MHVFPLQKLGCIAGIHRTSPCWTARTPLCNNRAVPPAPPPAKQTPHRGTCPPTRRTAAAPRLHTGRQRACAERLRGKVGGGGGGKRGGGGRGVRAAAGRRARRALRVGGGGRFNPPLPGGGGGGISIQAALREPGAPGALWDWAGSPVRGRRRRARRRRAGKRETWGGREGVRERGGARRGDLKGNSPPPSRRRTAGP